MQAYIDACLAPSIAGTRHAFETFLSWLRGAMTDDEVAAGMMKFAADSHADFEELTAGGTPNVRAFLPVPDQGKKAKSFWILPNLSSFTNIYARINLMHGGEIRGLRIFHDEVDHPADKD